MDWITGQKMEGQMRRIERLQDSERWMLNVLKILERNCA
jgi:hypothetical protein